MIIQPQPGPQTTAAKSKADIIVYGGGAGGGKSFFQAYRACKYHRIKGYNAALFRRTFTMLQGSGSLWDECMSFYPQLGASSTTRPLEFTWPFPSRVEFRHLQHEQSAEEHKSKQYAYLGFDEATDFTGRQFIFMLSRLRTVAKVKKQFVLTTNPDPDSYLRTWVDWWIGSDGFPDPRRDGVVRYFVRVKDDIVWASTPDDLLKYVDGPHEVKSFTFIKATVYDNKILLTNDKTYLGNLKALPAVEQARFLGGNWDIKESAGDLFQQAWFRRWYDTELERTLMGQDGNGSKVVSSIRWWDFAATPVKDCLVPGIERPADFKARDPNSDDPDWSYGVRLDRTADGRIIIGDAVAYRDTPGAIEAAVERHAQEDGRSCTVGWWQDVGQSAQYQSEKLAARLSKHAHVVCEPASKSKLEYAREPSRAAYRGELMYRLGKWNSHFFNQLQQFPSKDAHDDAVDALSGGWHYLQTNAPLLFGPDELRRLRAAGLSHASVSDGFFHPPTRESDIRDKNRGQNRFGRRVL